MVFSSVVFLYGFLPLVLLAYYLVPQRFRIGVLFVFSLAFYGYGEPLYIALMLLSILMNFIFGARVAKLREADKPRAKRIVALSVVFNLALLCAFKYTDFIIESLGAIPALSGKLAPLGITLPIGISFYTFQSMSYAIDIYRGDACRQPSFIKFGTYVSLFPQLIAGPIVRYKTIADQLDFREENAEKFKSGIVMFIIGLSKKVLLANSIGQLWESSAAYTSRSVLSAWLGMIAYTLQIYFDFGGYSDMAIGLGRMFGFEFPINFDYPYTSRSVSEFWSRRWHVSLGTWFREYLYIPLGGNRRGTIRTLLNLATVWLLTGFWHGAGWNFAIWGAYYAVLIILEKLFLGKWLKKLPSALSRLYTLLIVMFGWVVFALTDIKAVFAYFGSLFGANGAAFIDSAALYDLRSNAVLILVCAVASTPLAASLMRRFREKNARVYAIVKVVLAMLALALSTAYIVDASYNPFLYYRF